MHRDERVLRPFAHHEFSTFSHDFDNATEDCPRRRRAEAHQNPRADEPQFLLPPRTACGDLRLVWLFVQPALSTRLPLEMFHRVRDVAFRTIDAGIGKCAVEQFSSRADEWPAVAVFLISRLLAEKDDLRGGRSFAEDRLGGEPIKRARFTMAGTRAEFTPRIVRTCNRRLASPPDGLGADGFHIRSIV